MGAGAANPLIPMFREKELFGKLKLYTFDISPEVLDSVIAGEMGFGMDAQQYLMGYLPVIYMVENATHGFWPHEQLLHRPAVHRHAGQGPGHARPRQGRHPLSSALSSPPQSGERCPRPGRRGGYSAPPALNLVI